LIGQFRVIDGKSVTSVDSEGFFPAVFLSLKSNRFTEALKADCPSFFHSS